MSAKSREVSCPWCGHYNKKRDWKKSVSFTYPSILLNIHLLIKSRTTQWSLVFRGCRKKVDFLSLKAGEMSGPCCGSDNRDKIASVFAKSMEVGVPVVAIKTGSETKRICFLRLSFYPVYCISYNKAKKESTTASFQHIYEKYSVTPCKAWGSVWSLLRAYQHWEGLKESIAFTYHPSVLCPDPMLRRWQLFSKVSSRKVTSLSLKVGEMSSPCCGSNRDRDWRNVSTSPMPLLSCLLYFC